MHQSHDALPLPPRYDAALATGAILGYGGLGAFLLTQLHPALRVSGDTRFAIILWCVAISGPGAICWLLRPHITHLAYAMRLGRALAALPAAPDLPPGDLPPSRSIAGRRWIWGSSGTLGACAWTLAAAIDIGVATDRLNLHHANLAITTMLLCQIGAVCETVRIVGPSLAAVDDVYRLSHQHGAPHDQTPRGADVLPMRRSAS